MKKTILLASLVAVASMANGTTGTVKGFFESEGKFETTKVVSKDKKSIETKTDKSYKVGKVGVETEVKVKGTGLSFGGTFQGKDISLPLSKNTMKVSHKTAGQADIEAEKYHTDTFFNNSSIFVKYELPEMHKVNSYVKATLNPKVNTRLQYAEIDEANLKEEHKSKELSFKAGNVELEADINYEVLKDVKVGLNSKTKFPFDKKDKEYAQVASSTHKLYLDAKEVSVLKDVKAEVEVNHVYKESEKDKKDAFKYVSGKVEATYDKVKDIKLEGKVSFKRNVAEGKIGDFEVLGTKLFKEAPARYIHSYELKGTYTGVKDLTLTAKPFVAHINVAKTVTNDKLKRNDVVLYGAELGAEYKMLNNALTLTGKSLLAGVQIRNFDGTKDADKQLTKDNTGYFVFDANAKYDYKVTDKFTVSPEANANLSLHVLKVKGADNKETLSTEPELTLTPKVSAEYKPVESLTIKAGVELPINFGMIDNFKKDNSNYSKDGMKFGYKSTSIKTSLNVEYKW